MSDGNGGRELETGLGNNYRGSGREEGVRGLWVEEASFLRRGVQGRSGCEAVGGAEGINFLV